MGLNQLQISNDLKICKIDLNNSTMPVNDVSAYKKYVKNGERMYHTILKNFGRGKILQKMQTIF